MKKGDSVWFVDSGWEHEKYIYYPEHGIFLEDRNNGYCLIHVYFGDFEIAKDALFKSEEDCKNFLRGETK